ANLAASVPPPAPEPTMMYSYPGASPALMLSPLLKAEARTVLPSEDSRYTRQADIRFTPFRLARL
ncbi:MAG: hypothetical protein ACREVK_07935, partial [Gammaproteobacteria bacterium]